jgi:hypothetical protein
VDAVVVAPQQRVECRTVAGLRRRDERRVVELRDAADLI